MKKALKELAAVLAATCVSLWPVLAVAQTPSRRGGGIKYTATGGGGSGDVVGPGSANDNAIARFDGTTGKLLQDYTSGAPTISDVGDVLISTTTSPQVRIRADATSALAKFDITATQNALTFWKDSTPSKAAAIGMTSPAVGAMTDGIIFSLFDGSAWKEHARFEGDGTFKIKSTGAGTPTIFEVPASTTTNTGCLLLGTGAACAAANGQYVGGTTSPLTATTVTRSTTGSADVQKAEPELITLSTVGTTTPSVGNIVPVNSIIDAIACRVTTTITTATTWGVGITGDAAWNVIGTAGTTVATMTAGTTATFVAPAHNGMYNDTATTITITTTGTPGAGAIRCAVHSRTFTPPTS